MTLLRLTDAGLYCEAGDFHVDPWAPVPRAVVTHAHGDHVAWGCVSYLCSTDGARLLGLRLGGLEAVRTIAYGERIRLGGVNLSLHPAGHILGSVQVRLEQAGEVWVVSGDYKTDPDPTCLPFEPVRCHTFITESTFGLPIYRWPSQAEVFAEINAWWRDNAASGRTSLLYGYSLGKAQRLLAGLDPGIGPILTHGAVENMTTAYRAEGVTLPATRHAQLEARREVPPGAIVLAPPSADASTWSRRFAPSSNAFASGWMRVRGARRRQSLDRGFTLSDHADWPHLLEAIAAAGAERVWVTHGFAAVLARWLRDHGVDGQPIRTRFEGERDEPEAQAAPRPP